MVGWLASLALYKCRAFSPRVEPCCYFKPGGGYQPDRTEPNRDLSGKLGLICSVYTPRNRVEIIWAESGSEATLICSPACTGKTRALSLRFLTGWVHPHMCEENTYQIPVWICGPGSSPRVRGKLIGCAGVRVDDGLIPACAGKTVNIPHCICEEPAHPRACGENALMLIAAQV